MARASSQLRAALPKEAYTMSSSGFSPTSSTFSNIRSRPSARHVFARR